MDDIALEKELRMLNNDKRLTQMIVDNERNRYADMLKGDMGKDMDDVLSGKIKVKLSLYEKMKYKFNYWIDKLLNFF